MKPLVYKLTLEITKKNILNPLFFIILLNRIPGAVFLSKKILKKINIIDKTFFLHHPLFIKAFKNNYDFKSTIINIQNNKTIEYIQWENLIFYKTINLIKLFNFDIIVKNLINFFQNYRLIFNLRDLLK